jgi:Viral BACON domain
MKKILYISGFILFTIIEISCSDDFLSKNKGELYTLSDTLYLDNNQEIVNTFVQLPVLTNSGYTIFIQPKWLSFNSMYGKIEGGKVPLSFSIIRENIPTQDLLTYQTYFGTIILDIEDIGLISFVVAYSNFGSPTLHCSVSFLKFEASNQTFTIGNTSEGILNWNITGIPDWLVISSTSGSLNNGNSILITASLNWNNIPQSLDLSATLHINSNSTSSDYPIEVQVSPKAIIPPEVSHINGIVVDAEYSDASAIMVICTKSPNSLIVFNTNTNEANTISLSKTPNCVSLSEDGHKAVIGFSVSSVGYINIDNLEITRDYSIDCIPHDIVFGDNGWCYITPSVGQYADLRNLNLNSDELVGMNGNLVYGKTIIKKIHMKPYLIGTRPSLSPSGILIIDITKRIASDTISYFHEEIGDDFWISVNGTRLYAQNKKVYSLPEYNGQYYSTSPPVYGQIETKLRNISGLFECPAINSIFVISSYSDYNYSSEYATRIEQYNTTNLNMINKFNVSSIPVTENGITHIFETNPKFIFVNKEGSTLYAIKKIKETECCYVETIQLNNSIKVIPDLNNFPKTK